MGVRKRKATGNECASAEASSSTVAGPSSNPIVIDSPVKAPPAKRQRHKKDTDVPIPEKRGAVFKKRCPKNILDRLDRVFSQRFFMVDRRRVGSELREEFSVLGSTGNVYTVVIDNTPSCNCEECRAKFSVVINLKVMIGPDAIKGNHCKHILFIFLKVLQVTQDSGHWYQKYAILFACVPCMV
ncbi:hypothetical protein AcV7_008466 [Taiwanofungus camphoratus]|nr:hypothetical protein AcV7_008466 [Antrodia cinnamomea]